MSYEIFHQEKRDRVLWKATASTLDQARTKVNVLATEEPGDYIILSTQSGEKVFCRAGGVTDSPPAAPTQESPAALADGSSTRIF